jgi:hypothetical protein
MGGEAPHGLYGFEDTASAAVIDAYQFIARSPPLRLLGKATVTANCEWQESLARKAHCRRRTSKPQGEAWGKACIDR